MITSGRAAQLHGECLSDGEVDAVGERRDHQASVQAHVLVAVFKCTCNVNLTLKLYLARG